MAALDRILNSTSLPSLPTVAVRLLDLSRDPNAPTKSFVDAVQSDAAISAKILKLSNSSFLGIRSNVTTLQRAVTLLGTRTVTSMALGFSIARQSVGAGPLAGAFKAYWQRSVLEAVVCETLAERCRENSPAELFLAGLMADIGQLAMLRVLGGDYAGLAAAGLTGDAQLEAEAAAFGFDHAEAGGGLLGRWNFPPHLVECAARHHDAGGRPGGDSGLEELLGAVRVASATADYFGGSDPAAALQSLHAALFAEYGIGEADAFDFCEDVAEAFRANADLFDADADALPEPGDLMAAANEQLAARAVQAEIEQAKAEESRKELEAAQEALQQENESLRNQSVVDSLTGCFNRAFFDETLTQEVDVCRRNAKPLATLFIDVDRFKQLNDTYGHQFGDEVLAGVAGKLGKCVRESDVLCRYGGEEFVILARQPTESGLRALAERLRRGVEELTFVHECHVVSVTVSIGGAHTVPSLTDTTVAADLVREADQAMYECKHAGRNRSSIRSLLSQEEVALRDEAARSRFSVFLMRSALLGVDQVSEALSRVRPPAAKLGEIAVRHGVMTSAEVERVLAAQQLGGRRQRFGEVAVDEGFIDGPTLAALLGCQQEDPVAVAQSLVELGLLMPPSAASAVEDYRRTFFAAELCPA